MKKRMISLKKLVFIWFTAWKHQRHVPFCLSVFSCHHYLTNSMANQSYISNCFHQIVAPKLPVVSITQVSHLTSSKTAVSFWSVIYILKVRIDVDLSFSENSILRIVARTFKQAAFKSKILPKNQKQGLINNLRTEMSSTWKPQNLKQYGPLTSN